MLHTVPSLVGAHSPERPVNSSKNPDPSAFVANQELIEALDRHATPVDCGRTRVLFRQGEDPAGVYILRSGEVRLTMLSVAGEVVLRLVAGPGSVLGLPALIGSKPFSLTAEAEAGSDVGFVQRDSFNRLMAEAPMLSFRVLQILAAEVHGARRAIFDT